MADEEKKPEVFLYDLTDMTGRGAKSGRSVVIMTVEMRRGTVVAALVSALPALFVGGLTFPLLGQYCAFAALIVFGMCMFFFLVRQRRGLQLAQWRGWADKRRTRTDVVIQCNRVIDPSLSEARVIVPSSRSNPLRETFDEDALTDEALLL